MYDRYRLYVVLSLHAIFPKQAPEETRMESIAAPVIAAASTAAPPTPAAEAFVRAFAEGWRAPIDAEHFADHFERWMDPEIRLVQPQVPTTIGAREFRERFARPLFELLDDLHGTVEGWGANGDIVYIELRLEGTIGGRAVTLRTCDRVTLRDGKAVERVAHLDPIPMLAAIAATPRSWPRAVRQQLNTRRRSS